MGPEGRHREGQSHMTVSGSLCSRNLKSKCFDRTRQPFTKRVRFVTEFVTFGRKPRPGIAQTKPIWPQNGATYLLVSEMKLARGGF